jgi:hypothetical protein
MQTQIIISKKFCLTEILNSKALFCYFFYATYLLIQFMSLMRHTFIRLRILSTLEINEIRDQLFNSSNSKPLINRFQQISYLSVRINLYF